MTQDIADRRNYRRHTLPEQDEMQVFWQRLDQHQEEIVQLRESRAEDRARMTSLENTVNRLGDQITANHTELKIATSSLKEELVRAVDALAGTVTGVAQELRAQQIRIDTKRDVEDSARADARRTTFTFLKAAGTFIALIVAFVGLATFFGGGDA